MKSKFENKIYNRNIILSEKWKKTSDELRKSYIGDNIRFYIDTCTPIDIPFLISVLSGLLIIPLSDPKDALIISNTVAYIKNKDGINNIVKNNRGDYITQSEKLSLFSEEILNEILGKYLPDEKILEN